MMGHQGQSLPLIFSLLIITVSVVVAERGGHVEIVMEETGEVEKSNSVPQQSDLQSEEFRLWIEQQEQRVVDKIMDKISSPSDTHMQHQAKVAVAKYLVNVTFTAMTRRLETLKLAKKQGFLPETAALPVSALPETTTNIIMTPGTENGIQNDNATTTQGPVEQVFVFKGEPGVGESNNDGSLPSSASASKVPPLPPAAAFPASSPLGEQSIVSPNQTETATPGNSKPIWEEILTFNFSAALNGGSDGTSLLNRLNGGEGAGLLSRLNLTILGTGGDAEGGNLFDRLNFTALGGGGGNLFDQLNFTALGGGDGGNLFDRLNLTGIGGGEGGNIFERLNLTGIGGGEGGSLFERLNLTGIGGGEGGSLFERLNLTGLGGGGGANLFNRLNLTGGSEGGSILGRLNLTGLAGGSVGGEGGIFSRFNFSSLSEGGPGGLLIRLNFSTNAEGGEGGLPFNIAPPPEGLFNYPTPPPKNDSVRMSQMFLGSQVEKLMGDINNSNLTGIVEATINIATPSTVGVLVNALLNIVLCNPLDRFNGNCGIE